MWLPGPLLTPPLFQRGPVPQLPVLAGLSRAVRHAWRRSERLRLRPAAACRRPQAAPADQVSRPLQPPRRSCTLTPLPVHRCCLEPPSRASWAALTVHGFADAPVSWGEGEHGVLKGAGGNFYSLLMFPDHTYHLHLAAGAQDSCPP